MSTDSWSTTRSLREDFPTPGTDRWFEDYTVGDVREYGTITLSEEEIVDFARTYDPQRLHTDPEWAATGPFTGLIASGIQTIGVFMRLYADHYLTRCGSLASPGVDEVRWPRPVRPGDALRLHAQTLETRLSRSKPDRGLVVTVCELLNQDDEVVLSQRVMNLVAVRP
ncbi:MaoC family dehydratase [Ornithinimicrobium sp. F0845]|uniref:MaoC family dehydratase n=1 Tax=Ornithinimicrobium sp. F0845 TaxID=2926412 RepID=UPI001FF18CA6|nr:MaoC family dehydratase [Ornithinimicrobium sp. F0845]MCK0111410.1 MaoC family dehydratase [Ornithinimicrobium sp. F0845]